MQYFKNENDIVFAYDDDVSIEWINENKPGLTSITEQDAINLTEPSEEQKLVNAKN